jgi:hypothetical protein
MKEHLKERIARKLDTLSDERGYQVLDYIEFLESKYGERQAPSSAGAANPFTRFTDAVEDRLRAGRVSASAIAETMSLLNRAANVLNGAVAAGKSVATDIYTVAQSASRPGPQPSPAGGAPSTAPPSAAPPASQPAPEASSPAHDVKEPGSGQERL